jgi:hypothetical protein
MQVSMMLYTPSRIEDDLLRVVDLSVRHIVSRTSRER